MISSRRHALSALVGAAACLAVPAAASAATESFGYAGGSAQSWTVPAGVTEATFDLYGSHGGAFKSVAGGPGAHVQATIAVTPGETLRITVGGVGTNGGGAAGGGGATDVRRGAFGLADRLLVAGGGGGTGGQGSEIRPGAGSGQGAGAIIDGHPGTATEGGAGGLAGGVDGGFGVGGDGLGGCQACTYRAGGGGGGWYGGGSGGGSIGVGAGGSSLAPAGGTVEDAVNADVGRATVTYEATAPAELTLSRTGIDFGGVGARTTAPPEQVTVSNTGGSPLQVTAIDPTGTGNSLFPLLVDPCTGTTLAAGASCTLTVGFAPLVLGTWSPRLRVVTDAATKAVALSGRGVASLLTALGAPISAVRGNTNTVGGVVANTSNAPYTVTGVKLSGVGSSLYKVVGDTCTGRTLAPAASCWIDVSFSPLALGTWSPTLTVLGDRPGVTTTLPGTGTGPLGLLLDPPAFGDVPRRTTSPWKTVYVRNHDLVRPATITAVRRTGTGGSLFPIANDTCTGTTLQTNQHCSFDLRFAPLAAGTWTPQLVVVSDIGNLTTDLSGTGV